jgi:hypothetical protein
MQDKITRCLGWATQFNPLTMVPGALRKAENSVHRRENITEPRRGYKQYANLANTPKKKLTYLNRVLSHNGTKLSYDNGSGTFADYSGSYTAPSGTRMRFVEAFSNLYTTTDAGVKVFSNVTGTAGRLAGAPRALDPSYTLTGSTGFLANNFQCAYRSLVRRTDSQNNIITSYPSQRLWVVNAAGGARNVIITQYLPSEAATGDVLQFYRTAQVSGTSSDTAADEMGLIYQYELVAADISAGFITFTDSVTDDLRGATLYTSPSQEGIGQANDRPPLAKDICLYKSIYMLYANFQTKHRLSVSLVGATALGHTATGDTHTNTTLDNVSDTSYLAIGWKVSGTGIPAGTTIANIVGSTITLSAAATATAAGVTITFYTDKTITLGGVTYSFGATEIVSGAGSPQVQVSVTNVAAVDIDLTARSLIRVVNRYASNTTVYAYYLSGPGDLPGQMMIEEKGIGASAFTLQSSNSNVSNMFFPAPPVSPSTNTKSTSSTDLKKNALAYAKSQQPEAVPILNYLLVGPGNKEILRVVNLRDSAIIIKEEGVYRLTGETPQSFSIVPIDLTVFCKAPESVCVLANQVFMLSNQGVVRITESGVEVVSHDIEPELTPLLSVSTIDDYTFGCSYESERMYLLSTLTETSDTVNNQTLVYNAVTKVWDKWTFAFESAIVEPGTDKLYFSKPSDTKVYIERKDFADTDYADPESSITITSISGTTVEFTISGATPALGWVIAQGTTEIAIETLTSISGGYRAVLKDDPPSSWATGAATIYPNVGFDVEWHGWAGPGQAADTLKQVYGVGFLTDDIAGNNSVSSFVAKFASNFDQEIEEVSMTQPAQGWGAAWGSSPWGGSGDPFGYPTWVPRNKQYCTRLYVGVRHSNAREKISIAGVCFAFNAVSERIGR